MVHVEKTITVSSSIQDSFDFVADFRNLPKWNPNDESVELLTEGPLRIGSVFRIKTSINNRSLVLDYKIIVPIFIVTISFLLISKLPTYSLKKIIVPRTMTIFLLFGIVLFFVLLLIYTFKLIVISSIVYLCFIPISLIHYQKLSKKIDGSIIKDDDHEDIL